VSKTFDPTPEQQRALELFSTGESLAIEAGAGTGKTSTLQLLANSTERRGQYLAFNRAIVAEAARKFPKNVAVNTAHSLAMRAVGTPFQQRMQSGKRMRTLEVANRLGIDAINVRDSEGNQKHLSRSFLASTVLRAVERFCQSADETPTLWHVPYIEGLDAPNLDGIGSRRGVNNKFVAKYLEPFVQKAWADLSDTEGGLAFTTSTAMSVILKLWQLSDPKIGADFILFDEAQDANPVMVAVVAAQTHAQLVWVGDSQQQIYEFTGAINALAKVPAEHRTFLTQSFRFGPAVADVANHVLAQIPDAELRLIGTDQIVSTVAAVAQPDAILTRTNAAAVETVLSAIENETSVHLVGGGDDVARFARAAKKLMNNERTDHPELACFESWGEVQEYVAMDEQGGDLRLLVSLVDRFTVEVILAALDTQVPEHEADLVVSTAHKAKGREWDTVRIASDFPEDKIAGNASELRLLYVAVTRARRELDITAIPFLRDGYIPVVSPLVPVSAVADAGAEPEGEAQAEVVPTKPSEWVGRIGETLDLALRCEACIPLPNARYGPTNLCKLFDAEGNEFKSFIRDGLDEGKTYEVTAKVKAHETYQGSKQTLLNYLDVIQEVTV
jgi:UvrD-like helicase family protein